MCHWPRLGRRRGREPRVRRPPARRDTEPLAEGGFVLRRSLVAVAAVAALVWTATESLFAIGAGKQVVAVDEQSDYPKRAPRTKLSGYTPNVEAIATYRPDLVVLEFDPGDTAAGLRTLGIRVLIQSTAKDLRGAYAQIRRLGVITGHRKRANALVKRMKAQIKRAVASAPKRALSVY